MRFFLTLLICSAPTLAWADVVLRRGALVEPETLDVHKSATLPEYYIELDLFEGLLTSSASGEPVPGVAESWAISEDGRVYTFSLRRDAKWSDGAPVTARDFVFSWRRAVAPETASPYIALLWPILNAKAIAEGKETDRSKLGVEALDDRTLRVTLHHPAPHFPSILIHHVTFPIQEAAYTAHGPAFIRPEHFVGNGPFVLAEHVPHSHIKLARNPHFHSADQIHLDAVYYYPIDDQNAELRRYRAGELDITGDVPSAQIPWVRQTFGGQFHSAPTLGVYFYGFNLRHEPWRNAPKLRRALSLAIDRDLLVEKILQGGEVPAYGIVPPGTAGYEPPAPDQARLMQADRDALARRMLAEAGYGPGKPLKVELLFNSSENHKRVAMALAAMWREKLGVHATTTNREWKLFLNDRKDRTYKDLARDRLVAIYNDPLAFLETFRSDQEGGNVPSYADPVYDDLLARAATMPEAESRSQTLRMAEERLIADSPVIPLFFFSSRHLVADHVKGWQDNPSDLHPSRHLRIERP
ncbi:MAG TPA: peptide ABC transporter substrate-binding protein [Azospirillaceae bacterium]|nr:peptide ABC transporter substrate-binding protein [Azospirillaceae bacterium]